MTDKERPLVIFDLDGTLAETARDILECINDVIRPHGAHALTFERDCSLVSFGGRRIIRHVFHENDIQISDDDVEKLFRAFIDHYETNIARHTVLFPRTRETLQLLTDASFNLAVCTNKSSGPCHALLRKLDIDHFFCAIVANDTFPWSKPDRRALLSTIELAKGCPKKSVMVGDSRTDVDAARAAGIPVVVVDFGYSDVPVAELAADSIISNFIDLDREVRKYLT